MHRDQLELLKELQAQEFTSYEFVLYLDTHPNDQRALTDYARNMNETERLRNMYAMKYGPLVLKDNAGQPCWRWIEEPWPWQIEY